MTDVVDVDERRTIERARSLLAVAVAELAASAARDEALAELVAERRTLGVRRRPRMRSVGRVWRLGVLLLGRDGRLHATGRVVRATAPGHPNFQSESGEARRADRRAAFDGPFTPGETVDYDATRIDWDDVGSLRSGGGPLVLSGGQLLVRWSTTAPASLMPFDAYLRERVELLVHPPEGA